MVNKRLICRSGWREACLPGGAGGNIAGEGNVEVDVPYSSRPVRVEKGFGKGFGGPADSISGRAVAGGMALQVFSQAAGLSYGRRATSQSI